MKRFNCIFSSFCHSIVVTPICAGKFCNKKISLLFQFFLFFIYTNYSTTRFRQIASTINTQFIYINIYFFIIILFACFILPLSLAFLECLCRRGVAYLAIKPKQINKFVVKTDACMYTHINVCTYILAQNQQHAFNCL